MITILGSQQTVIASLVSASANALVGHVKRLSARVEATRRLLALLLLGGGGASSFPAWSIR